MNRAERRRAEKQATKAKTVTYNYTKEQLDALVKAKVKEEVANIKKQATEDAVDVAVTLMLALPLEVLIGDGYWAKSAKRRIPRFIEDVLDIYDSWQKGVFTLEELREDLWKYAGVKLEAPKGTEEM